MKKIIPLLALLLVTLMIWMNQKPDPMRERVDQSPPPKKLEAGEPQKSPAAAPAPEPPIPAAADTVAPETVERDWMALTLQHRLSPETLEAWAKREGVPLHRETKGHPASGERLELSWGEDPVTTAVFDVVSEERYQLSAVRSVYPSGSAFHDLKLHMQHAIKRPVEREDAQSLVFRADEEGLVVWMARENDGRIKLAFEYGAHSHESKDEAY